MFNNWLTLRQADDALKQGRLEEALRLAQQPDLQGHKRSGEIMREVAQAYLRRAQLHLDHDDASAAWKELLAAEKAGSHDKHAVKLRQELVYRGLNEVKALLMAGEPHRATELVERLRERQADHGELTVLEEVAKSWSLAQELTSRGEFGQAVSVLDRGGRQFFKPLEDFRLEVKHKHREFESLLGQLHKALELTRWREVIQLADQVLAIAPQHAESRKARSKAWRAVEPPTVASVNPHHNAIPEVTEAPAEELPRRMLLWIDGVGGYLLCLSSRVSIGQATPDAYVDIPLFADVSRLHGYLTRDAEGYLLEAVRTTSVNQQPVEKALLRDGDRVTFGSGCQVKFYQPSSVSATARLEIASGHRLALSVDGVLLMADTCIIGQEGHVVLPDLPKPVVLIRRKDSLAIQSTGEITVDGKIYKDRALLSANSTVTLADLRLTLEPVGTHLGNRRT